MRRGRVSRAPLARDDDDRDLAFALGQRVMAGVKMAAERSYRLRQPGIVHPDLARPAQGAAGLEQRVIALLLLGRHLVIGNLGIATKGRRLGHGRSPQRSATRQRIYLRAARRRGLRRPGLTAVMTAPDLAAVGGARHPVRLM